MVLRNPEGIKNVFCLITGCGGGLPLFFCFLQHTPSPTTATVSCSTLRRYLRHQQPLKCRRLPQNGGALEYCSPRWWSAPATCPTH